MDYPCLVLEEKANNLDIKLIGVRHIKPFFEAHKEFFRQEVSKANAICMEETVVGNHSQIDALNYDGFYGRIANFARDKNIPIYEPDTSNVKQGSIDLAQYLLGMGLILSSSIQNKKDTSRRNFLKRCGRLLFGAYLASESYPVKGHLPNVFDKETVIDDAWAYNTIMDYRNLVSAENLDRMSKKIKIDGQVPYFIGNGHVKGIHAYLTHPLLRKKRLLYLPQDMASDPAIKKYEFREGSWRLTERI